MDAPTGAAAQESEALESWPPAVSRSQALSAFASVHVSSGSISGSFCEQIQPPLATAILQKDLPCGPDG